MSWAWEKEGEGGGGAEKYHTLIFFIYVQLLCLSLLLSLMLQCRFNVKSKDQSCPSERYLLYQEWAHPKSFYKLQPLDLIRWRTVLEVSSWTWFKSDWHQDTEDIQYLSLPLLQKVLRREDRHLLRLVGFLHCDAGCGCCRGTGLLHLRI